MGDLSRQLMIPGEKENRLVGVVECCRHWFRGSNRSDYLIASTTPGTKACESDNVKKMYG